MNVALMVQPENNKTQVQPDSSTTILQTAIQDGLPHSTDIQSTACLAVPLLSHFQLQELRQERTVLPQQGLLPGFHPNPNPSMGLTGGSW